MECCFFNFSAFYHISDSMFFGLQWIESNSCGHWIQFMCILIIIIIFLLNFSGFLNTVSNVPGVVLGLIGLINALRQGFEKRFSVLHISNIILAIGSILHHSSLHRLWVLLLFLPSLLFLFFSLCQQLVCDFWWRSLNCWKSISVMQWWV